MNNFSIPSIYSIVLFIYLPIQKKNGVPVVCKTLCRMKEGTCNKVGRKALCNAFYMPYM